MTFGKLLKEKRKKAKLTQAQLAKISGLSRTYLSDVENNRYKPSLDFIKKVSKGISEYNNLNSEEATQNYNALLKEAGYGFISARDITPEEIAEQFDKIKHDNHITLKNKISNIDFTHLNEVQIAFLENAIEFSNNYSGFNDNNIIKGITAGLRSLNQAYSVYQDDDLTAEAKIKLINEHIDDLVSDDNLKYILGSIKERMLESIQD